MQLDDSVIEELKIAASKMSGFGSIELIFCGASGFVDIITHDRRRVSIASSQPPRAGEPVTKRVLVARQK